MPDTNPEKYEYATGYIMPVLSVDEPEIVAPFTAEKFREANDIASKTVVQTSISDIQDNIDTVISPSITGIQDDIENNIKPSITGIQEDIEYNKTNIAQIQDAQDVIKDNIVDIQDDIKDNVKADITDIQTDIDTNIKPSITSIQSDIISTITPSIPLGGLTADVTLEDMTALQILKKMLEKELFSIVAANKPSASLSRSGDAEVELGTVITKLTLTASGDRGTYSPYYYKDSSGNVVKGTSHDYAGAIESYTFSGSGISNAISQTANTFDISNYTVGTSNSWTVKVLFADGEKIMSSQGNFGTPAKYTDASDTGKTASASITPTFPIYITSSNPSVLTRRSSNVKTSNSYIEVTLPIEDSPDGTNYNKLAFLVPTSWLDGAYRVDVYNEGNGQWENETANWTEYTSTITWTDGTESSLTFTGAAVTTIASKTISGDAPKAGEYKLVVNSGGLVTVAPKVRFYR